MELASFFLYYLTSVLFLRYGDFLQPGDANVESAFFDLRFDMVILYSQGTPMWNLGNSEIPSAVGYLNCPDFCSLFRFIYSHLFGHCDPLCEINSLRL